VEDFAASPHVFIVDDLFFSPPARSLGWPAQEAGDTEALAPGAEQDGRRGA
jgi:hypothetical protein